MAYITTAQISTHDFGEDHRTAILAIDSGDQRLRTRAAYELAGMGLARVAENRDWGNTVLTRRGEAMVAYLREYGDDWR